MNAKHDAAAAAYFPLVGAQGVAAEAAAPYDGRWRLLNDAGQVLTGDTPGLARVEVTLRFGYLVLRAPGMLRLDIPLDVLEDDPSVLETVTIAGVPHKAADEGAWAHAWFSEVLGQPVRLVKLCEPVPGGV